jgi:uncharacterized protein
VRARLNSPVFAVLGNHDTIRMVPGLEDMGIRMLLNESEELVRGDNRIYLAGIDDAHYYRVDNIEKAAAKIPPGAFSILLSHMPEIYRQAAHAGFDLLLSGHTHGGQICLPGSIPITLDSVLPRRMGSGPWSYGGMAGYTSSLACGGACAFCLKIANLKSGLVALRQKCPANSVGISAGHGARCALSCADSADPPGRRPAP